MSSVGEWGVWRSKCQLYRGVEVGVSKYRGVWKLEFQVYRRVEVGVSSAKVGVSSI